MRNVIGSLLNKVNSKLAEIREEHQEAVQDGKEWGLSEWSSIQPDYDISATLTILRKQHVEGLTPKESIQSVNPEFRSAGTTITRALERKLAQAIVSNDSDCLDLVRGEDIPKLLVGQKYHASRTQKQLDKLDMNLANITEPAGDLNGGLRVDKDSSPTDKAQANTLKQPVSRAKQEKKVSRAVDNRSNILHERVRRAAIEKWQGLRQTEIPEPKQDLPQYLETYLEWVKKYGLGAGGLITGNSLSALGDGREALEVLSEQLETSVAPILDSWFKKLLEQKFTGEESVLALAALFLMVEREGRLPDAPHDDNGVTREDSVLDLYELHDMLGLDSYRDAQSRESYWWLTERGSELAQELGAALADLV